MEAVFLLMVALAVVGAASAPAGAQLWCVAANATAVVNIDKVCPPVKTPPGVAAYLGPLSCLGYLGPIGPYGPLSVLGPLGDGSWSSAQYWISGAFDWDEFAKQITGLGGPLSAEGPLGSNGPMTKDAIYRALPRINDFAHQMLPCGLWTVLGPLGPLGALGALGPLGPIGAHGYKADSDGRYVDSHGRVQSSVVVPFNASFSRTFELFERYTQEFASTHVLDTSFMVDGVFSSLDPESNTFAIRSAADQAVTVLVVPQFQLDAFSLAVPEANVATSSMEMISWLQFHAKAGELLHVVVDLYYSGQLFSKPYTLYVVGGTNEFLGTDITGPHIMFR